MALVFVSLFGFSMFSCFFWFSLDYLVLASFAFEFCLFLQYYAKRLAGKNVSEVTGFVSSGM